MNVETEGGYPFWKYRIDGAWLRGHEARIYIQSQSNECIDNERSTGIRTGNHCKEDYAQNR